MTKPDFWKKFPFRPGAPKCAQNVPKIGFFANFSKSVHLIFLIFCRNLEQLGIFIIGYVAFHRKFLFARWTHSKTPKLRKIAFLGLFSENIGAILVFSGGIFKTNGKIKNSWIMHKYGSSVPLLGAPNYAQNLPKLGFFANFSKSVHLIFLIFCRNFELLSIIIIGYVALHRKFWFARWARSKTLKMRKIAFFGPFSENISEILIFYGGIVQTNGKIKNS